MSVFPCGLFLFICDSFGYRLHLSYLSLPGARCSPAFPENQLGAQRVFFVCWISLFGLHMDLTLCGSGLIFDSNVGLPMWTVFFLCDSFGYRLHLSYLSLPGACCSPAFPDN